MMRLDLMVSYMEEEKRSSYTLLLKRSLRGSGSGEMMTTGWGGGLIINKERFGDFIFIAVKDGAWIR